ncbi:MAG: hypothetical protein ACRD5H_18925 [Nitrososphaerales archaeon]
MVVKRKKIIIDGVEVEVDAFDTRLNIAGGKEEETIDALIKEEEIELEVKKVIERLNEISKAYVDKKRDIWFYFKIGKILQFVDSKKFTNERMQIWERIANNLIPEAFFKRGVAPKKAKTYPETMYLLAKQNEVDVSRISWSHWFEIFQYPKIYGNRELVKELLLECETRNLSSENLRKRIQEINKSL